MKTLNLTFNFMYVGLSKRMLYLRQRSVQTCSGLFILKHTNLNARVHRYFSNQ